MKKLVFIYNYIFLTFQQSTDVRYYKCGRFSELSAVSDVTKTELIDYSFALKNSMIFFRYNSGASYALQRCLASGIRTSSFGARHRA